MNELRHSAKISISPRLTPTTVFKLNLGTAWPDLSIISWEQVTYDNWYHVTNNLMLSLCLLLCNTQCVDLSRKLFTRIGSSVILTCALHSSCFSSSYWWRRNYSTGKCPCALHPISSQSSQGCLQDSSNVDLVEHRSFPTFDGEPLATLSLCPSFLCHLLRCFGPSSFREFLKLLSTTALPVCRAAVMSLCLSVFLPVHYIPSDSGWPGQ